MRIRPRTYLSGTCCVLPLSPLSSIPPSLLSLLLCLPLTFSVSFLLPLTPGPHLPLSLLSPPFFFSSFPFSLFSFFYSYCLLITYHTTRHKTWHTFIVADGFLLLYSFLLLILATKLVSIMVPGIQEKNYFHSENIY